MRYVHDKKMLGHACSFDNPIDMVRCVDKVIKAGKVSPDFGWERGPGGVYIKDWNEVLPLFFTPWQAGIDRVKEMLEVMRNQHLPMPTDRRRRGEWSDVQGDVDVDRVMAGEYDYMRNVRRKKTHGITTVSMLCNLDGNCGSDATKVFWRGAAAVAACELLEGAGYQTEVWLWNAGYRVYQEPNDKQFITVRLKAAGEDVNINTMINALSAWFLRLVVFPSFHCADARVRAYGSMSYDLDVGWRKYMDITDGVLGLEMPIAKDQEAAIKGAIEMLGKVEEEVA